MMEDWPILLSFFPNNWGELASDTDALKGLRKDKATENYMGTLLIHIACGHSPITNSGQKEGWPLSLRAGRGNAARHLSPSVKAGEPAGYGPVCYPHPGL